MNRIITTKDVLDRLLELSATYPYATFYRVNSIDVCFYDEATDETPIITYRIMKDRR